MKRSTSLFLVFILLTFTLSVNAQAPTTPSDSKEVEKVVEKLEREEQQLENMMIPDCKDLEPEQFWNELDNKFHNKIGDQKQSIPRYEFKGVVYRGSDGVGVFTCGGIIYICKNEMPDDVWQAVTQEFELIE